jgi:hypothetical protein
MKLGRGRDCINTKERGKGDKGKKWINTNKKGREK